MRIYTLNYKLLVYYTPVWSCDFRDTLRNLCLSIFLVPPGDKWYGNKEEVGGISELTLRWFCKAVRGQSV
jgi:hypothetical protein